MTEPRPRSALERLHELDRARAAGLPPRRDEGAGAAPPRAPITAPEAGRARGAWGGALGSALVGGVLLLWKLKGVALLLLSQLKWLLVGLKLLSLGKFLTTFLTMGLMVWTYSWFFGWRFALGLVLLILVHELGHGAAARWLGFRVGAPVFVPFFGAFIALRDRVRTTFQDFVIGAGGPLAGTAGGLAAILLARLAEPSTAALLFVVGYFTLIINLFNLLPIGQLDGGRMTAPITPVGWAIGAGLLLLATVHAVGMSGELQAIPSILLLVVVVMAVRSVLRARRAPPSSSALERLAAADARARGVEEQVVTRGQRRLAALTYFGLATALVYLTHLLPAGLPSVGA